MKIALVGYGKMGHMIESVAVKRGNVIAATIDTYAADASVRASSAEEMAEAVKNCGAEGVIEFTNPDTVMGNISALLPLGIPIVVGTTGWSNHIDAVASLAETCGGTLFYAANFSIGVNLFYRIVSAAAALMKNFDEYDTAVWEAHHNQKADSPSGTALEIAAKIMAANSAKTEIVTDAFHSKPKPNQLHVSSTRIGSVPGTHSVFFDSPSDTIELTHMARSREGFAVGAVRAMAWLHAGLSNGSLLSGKLYTMSDLLP
ncbi:MAG: 4-hydroxy-tetrahydrodipicolinate reductase [Bacteroides sp.]|nr:4-hydroxy-tetrahydrodipicolinate reductase [Prevotella sp.]MCM1408259.1 4-hydroxy-tetrahydrodipicolinate reductase [Treponema brennaborense]MCM1470509.1 4-hydroxy-tetrahydrodipicolinate reductase [Bacteroides sp.]